MLFQEEETVEDDDDDDHEQNVEIIFSDTMYILHHSATNFCLLVIFHTFFTLISLKGKSTNNHLICGFQLGIYHSQSLVHSTTLLCDYVHLTSQHFRFCILDIFYTFFALIH